jgi:hypothetical protein
MGNGAEKLGGGEPLTDINDLLKMEAWSREVRSEDEFNEKMNQMRAYEGVWSKKREEAVRRFSDGMEKLHRLEESGKFEKDPTKASKIFLREQMLMTKQEEAMDKLMHTWEDILRLKANLFAAYEKLEKNQG